MIVLIDNYDSFTYNLVDLVQKYEEVKVIKNDAYLAEEVCSWQITKLILSPGPGKPQQSGISMEVLRYFWDKIPILGVCLGHQIIAEAVGATVIKAKLPVHGKTSKIIHNQQLVFEHLPTPFEVMRYHSLIIEKNSLPACLKVTAYTEDNEIMAIQHESLPIIGLQFHPESVLTQFGDEMIQNWLSIS